MRRLQAAQTQVNLFHTDFTACDAYRAGSDVAAQVRCPVHFVLGTRDQMTLPRHSEALARELNATVHRLDVGHALMSEDPDGVLAALRLAVA
jgi:pimeloyl-ACP methyl ester carboxylesterase